MRNDERDKRLMAYSAAAMAGGATALGLVESLLPGGQTFGLEPSVGALAVVILVLAVGPRLPIWALATLGPIGAALIALAIATTPEPGDGAVFYAWPVLWCAYFFGPRGAALIIVWIGVVHGVAVASLSGDASTIDRWLDVVVSMSIVAAVVSVLAGRNRQLLSSSLQEARTDQLTGLLNRRGFDERVGPEIVRARREESLVGVATFDIDHFKRVNDEWGHDAGDRVLVALADTFKAETRAGDIAARMGGEEFTVVLPALDEPGQAMDYAERIRAAFAGMDLGVGPTTISAGVTVARSPESVQPLLLSADSALYEAKCKGRDRAVLRGCEVSGGPLVASGAVAGSV
jgi:diguanylate cyclase (GGDEF)-like protein